MRLMSYLSCMDININLLTVVIDLLSVANDFLSLNYVRYNYFGTVVKTDI